MVSELTSKEGKRAAIKRRVKEWRKWASTELKSRQKCQLREITQGDIARVHSSN